MTLYSLKTTENGYQIFKLGDDFEHQATYELEWTAHDKQGRDKLSCSCPAGARPNCRHREMAYLFTSERKIDKGWLFDYDNRQWHEPIHPIEPETNIIPLQPKIRRRF